ncbi:MAG: ATP-binding protein [Phycisphaerales bacterium]
MNATVKQPVADASHVAQARRVSASVAAAAGLNDEAVARLALIVSEGATNLLKHGSGGYILFDTFRAASHHGEGTPAGVQALFVDKGRGIADTASAMRDGFSTSGTMGGGLGAMHRAATLFDLYSLPGKGTVVLCTLAPSGSSTSPASGGRSGGLCVPYNGETVSGDAWRVAVEGHRSAAIMVDGLGHGPMAARAAGEAVAAWQKDPFRPVAGIIALLDGALRSTRGGAAAVAQINPARNVVSFAGVGNIVAMILGGAKNEHCVSMNGTLGQFGRPARTFDYPWSRGCCFIMHSDGLASRWNESDYPGLFARSPALIAAVLHRDLERGRDDASVVVIKETPA